MLIAMTHLSTQYIKKHVSLWSGCLAVPYDQIAHALVSSCLFLLVLLTPSQTYAQYADTASAGAEVASGGKMTPSQAHAVSIEGIPNYSKTPAVLILRSDVSVNEVSPGGINQPAVELTKAAHGGLVDALGLQFKKLGYSLQSMDPSWETPLVNDYRALINTLLDAAIHHQLFSTDPLPNKAKPLDWSIGPGLSELGAQSGADFALLFGSWGQYEARGKRMLRLLGIQVGGLGEAESESQISYAALFDMRTGRLLWFYTDISMPGDLRHANGRSVWAKEMTATLPKANK